MVNASLLEETMAHIRSYPELHHQYGYYEVNEFGLAACFAARSLLIAGYTPLINTERVGAVSCLVSHPDTKVTLGVWDEARDVLGLTGDWAKNLFTSTNTRKMLEQKVKDVINGSPLDRYHELIPSRA